MNLKTIKQDGMDRRDFLKIAGTGTIVLTAVPLSAEATPASTVEAIGRLIGAKAPLEDKVSIILPEIAENGGTVPLKVSVDSPMTADDHVTAIHMFADDNPLPDVASFFFGPHNGKAFVSIRVRLARTQNMVAVAETSDGKAYIGRKKIKVTIGGCGG